MVQFIFVLFLIVLPASVQAVVEYQLDVQLLPNEQRLFATAVISPDDALPRQIVLNLASSCELIAVHQNGEPLDFEFASGRIEISLQNRSPFSISYRGVFADQVSSRPIHNEDPSHGVSAVISPAGTFLSAAADWYPRLGRDDIRYRINITTPPGTEAVTSGRRILRQNAIEQSFSIWEIDYPLYGVTLCAGNYQVLEEHTGPIPIYAYFYPQTAALAGGYLKKARQYLDLYVELFGSYPFHKFAVVENFFPTGYGFPSWTLLGSSVIRLPFIVETSLGHEMAHSWWGTGVRVDYSQGNWSEGLTTYVADYLYKEMTSPAEALEYRLKILRDYAGLVNSENRFPLNRFLSRNDKASQAIGYGKATMLFHMLRKQVGEETFWPVLRQIAIEKRFKQIAWSDFSEYYSLAAGYDLSPFFTQWLQHESGPKLTLSDVSFEKIADGYLVRGTVRQEMPHYQLAIEILVATENGEIRKQVAFANRSQTFSIKTSDRPLLLKVDPDVDLFRWLAREEIPPAVNAIRASEKLLILTADKHVPSQEAMQTLLAALRKQDLPVQKLAEVNPTELAGHDLLVFGSSASLQPRELLDGIIKLPDNEIGLESKSVFVVRSHPLDNDRVVAWFLSDNTEHAKIVARKIPHYGKYSYLLFDKGANSAKGILPPTDSPLTVKFGYAPSTDEEI